MDRHRDLRCLEESKSAKQDRWPFPPGKQWSAKMEMPSGAGLRLQNSWACSMSEVHWPDEGFESSKLAYLALCSGFYYDRHRAVHDCHAAIELLSRPLPVTGGGALAALLASARGRTVRCWAENSPFESKDVLKQRGYRWNGDDNGQPRAWWIDVREADIESEKAFLCAEIYKRDMTFRTVTITALTRHSNRILPA